ncbi:hypothetical protein NW766_003131 [Fusarium irregulare]|uniref:Nephrocystin 3-like N-terminal domain-containing protein n=1 Tax=Fusarium irregulare TaxID=2494466 RepID=A0A9W8UD63_9HYPO|nr:hypothetical protein NW766_003131 [Fusarium irregulare]
MSGAEVLAGIGILCNVMQIVTFGKDALEVYNYVRENGTADPRLEAYLTDALISYRAMRNQLSAYGPLTSDQQELIKVGEDAHRGLERLRAYFTQLCVDSNSRNGFRGRLKVARCSVKNLFRGKELENLEKDFERYQRLFQTCLIQRACSQGYATAILTQDSFASLSTIQQSMVKRIAEGHTEISLLVGQRASEVKDHVTDQHAETRTTMGYQLAATERKLRYHLSESTSIVQQDLNSRNDTEDVIKKYDQLLASLRYPEMNSRKNQVVESFPQTFQWIFSDETPGSSEHFPIRTQWRLLNKGPATSSEGYNFEEKGANEGSTEDHDQSSERGYDNKQRNKSSETVRGKEERTGIDIEYDCASTASPTEAFTVFTRWLRSESRMFWVSGKPGSGKSTVMKFIGTSPATQEHITVWRPGVRILSHYFWKAGTPMEKSLKGLLLSLTHQALLDRSALSKELTKELPDIRHKWSHADWDLQEIESALLWVLKAAAEPFLLLIDGLDESEEFGKHLTMRARNLTILGKLSSLKNVKICFSSREEYIFSIHFDGVERLQIHQLTGYDIRQFAASRLKTVGFVSPWDEELVLELIAMKADGVFLWVVLVVDSVIRAFRVDSDIDRLIERVNHMPRDLIDLFRDMWERSGEDGDIPSYRASASRYFRIALEQKPLSGVRKQLWIWH